MKNTISKETFESLMARAMAMQELETDRSAYWTGFMRGLRRTYHGPKFGTEAEHKAWLAAADPGIIRSAGNRGRGATLRPRYFISENISKITY